MQKNDFEKQVQQKMQDLNFSPSNAVWKNIEASITKAKRRKIGWIFLFLLFISLGVGYWILNTANDQPQKENNLSKTYHKDQPAIYVEKKSRSKTEKEDSQNQLHTNLFLERNTKTGDWNKKLPSKSYTRSDPKARTLTTLKIGSDISKTSLTEAKNTSIAIKETKKILNLRSYQKLVTKDTAFSSQEQNTIPSPLPVLPYKNNDSSLKITVLEKLKENEVKSKPVKAGQNKLIKSWNWGFTLSAGKSGVPDKFLGSLDKSFTVADAFSTAIPPSPNLILPTKIKSAGAVIAGIYGEKIISKRNMLTIGANFKMFSSTNKVGTIDQISRRYTLSNPVNNYHNYYYFIELPAAFKSQLFSKPFPVFWDAGISVSQLISSNALQFNNVAIVYYKQNSLFNKTQLGVSSGLSASLFSRGKTVMQIGPFINYSSTKIAREGLYKNQHFTFIGIRSQILFRK